MAWSLAFAVTSESSGSLCVLHSVLLMLSSFVHPELCLMQVQLQRERLELSPVFSTAMQHGDHMTGYIRLVNFSQKAAPDMRHAIADLQVHNPK